MDLQLQMRLLNLGVDVLLLCRNEKKGVNAERHLNSLSTSHSRGKATFIQLDLADIDNIKQSSKKILQISSNRNISLILNAGMDYVSKL